MSLRQPGKHMPYTRRIGIQIGPHDPFWVQVREVTWQQAEQLQAELVDVDIDPDVPHASDMRAETLENLSVQQLDALIVNTYSQQLVWTILERGIPVIYVSEIALSHPRFVSRTGLYRAGEMVGTFLRERLPDGGTILVIGGLVAGEDQGESRLDGFHAACGCTPYQVDHLPTDWLYDDAYQRSAAYFAHNPGPIDAIFGLSDLIAIAARDAFRTTRAGPLPLIVGVNGDPLAIGAIVDGTMTATIETDVEDIARQALGLALRAACGEALPDHFENRQLLVSAENVAEVAARKLSSLANLPSRLVGVNRKTEQQRVVQLETSLAIDRQVGLILNEQELAHAITARIRDNYQFDFARFLLWNDVSQELNELNAPWADRQARSVSFDPDGPLAYVLKHNQRIFIPDTHASARFRMSTRWPHCRSRVVVPVHLGGVIVGLLDLHRSYTAHYSQQELDGLQLLADQLGISMRNAELYGQALAARSTAEQADRLKTVLLANVSHELRTPINVIMSYSRASLDTPVLDLQQVRNDLAQIYQSGVHLQRLINDLLDVSRAEIGALDLFSAPLAPHPLLQDLFDNMVKSVAASPHVAWHLDLPAELPTIRADAVRLRQVVMNLLHNAWKYTLHGHITLGAEVAPPHLHIWVEDTGAGIAADQQERIFEPFVTAQGMARAPGIGLGLSITRRLVALHHGSMTLESQPGRGSTFHVYMPLLSYQQALLPTADGRPTLLLVSTAPCPNDAIMQICARRKWDVYPLPLHTSDSSDPLMPGHTLPFTVQPVAIAWDLARASASDWSLLQQVRSHPQLCQLPLITFNQDGVMADETTSLTGVVLKPVNADTLRTLIDDLRPASPIDPIVIVDDDPQAYELYRRVIAEHMPGHPLIYANGGKAALALFERQQPGMVILDLVMPEIDGFAVLDYLRSRPATQAVPILILSGQMLSFDALQRLDQAAVTYQSKAILNDQELAHTVQRTLNQTDVLPVQTSALVRQAVAYIQHQYRNTISRQDIAHAIGVHKDYLSRIFQRELGICPWDYLTRYRISRARQLLLTTPSSISDIATQVGFEDTAYFSRVFHREVGCSPRAYRERRTA